MGGNAYGEATNRRRSEENKEAVATGLELMASGIKEQDKLIQQGINHALNATTIAESAHKHAGEAKTGAASAHARINTLEQQTATFWGRVKWLFRGLQR